MLAKTKVYRKRLVGIYELCKVKSLCEGPDEEQRERGIYSFCLGFGKIIYYIYTLEI